MATGTIPATGTPRAGIAPILTAAGFTRVAENISGSATAFYGSGFYKSSTSAAYQAMANTNLGGATWTADVWRSNGATNGDGADWFLTVMDTPSTSSYGHPALALAVSEGFDLAAGRLVRGCPNEPTAAGTAPAADYSFGTSLAPIQSATTFNMGPRVELYVHATERQVFIGTEATSGSQGAMIAGLGERLLPSNIEVRTPLLNVVAGYNINFQGYVTREPLATAANATNFRLMATAAAWGHISTDPVTGVTWSHPVPMRATRASGGIRLVIPELRMLNVASAAGDVLNEIQFDGSTISYTAIGSSGYYFRHV